MAYVDPDYKTKKAFKEAVERGVQHRPYPTGLGTIPENGTINVEGPHYPKAHTWYVQVTLVNGIVTKVK